MIGVALPSIRSDLHMSTSSLQWVVSGYVLGYGGFLLLGGRAADLFGRRRMFLIALAVFLVASALGGFANDPTLLIATRFFMPVVVAAVVLAAAIPLVARDDAPVRSSRSFDLLGALTMTAGMLLLVFT